MREGGPIGVACVNFIGRIGGEGVEGARHDCEIFSLDTFGFKAAKWD